MVVIDGAQCNGCELCADVCPEGAIAMDLIAVVNRAICQECFTCVDVCPTGAISISSEHRIAEAADRP